MLSVEMVATYGTIQHVALCYFLVVYFTTGRQVMMITMMNRRGEASMP
jgi:hypothetical protein